MFQRSQCSFLLTLFGLEYILTTSLAVHIKESAFTCALPECTTVTFHCQAGEEVEWLNPNNIVISSTTTDRIHTIADTGFVTITNPQVTDSGIYTCRVKANHSDYDEVILTVTQDATFIFSSGFIYEEKTALRYTNMFVNCSVNPTDAYTVWYFESARIYNNDKYSQNNSGLTIHNVTEEDQGHYICLLGNEESLNATILLNVVWPPELYLPQSRMVEVNISEEVTLNCSTSASPDPVYSWLIPDSCSSCPKFSNDSVMIFTVDASSSGEYICVAENDYGTDVKEITISVIWPPELLLPQNRMVEVTIGEEVTLNCSASSSPDPVYTWLIPDSCSSCPEFNDDSVMTFTVDISSSGEYICIAENNYGSDTKQITINVLTKPMMAMESVTIIMEQRNNVNIVLTCDVQNGYPPPTIEWYIMTPLSDDYTVIQENSTNYKLYNNGSVEISHQFMFEIGYVMVMCSATNVYGSGESIFQLWGYEVFMKKQEFKIYIYNITDCENLKKDKELFRQLVNSLREWFDSACKDYCNGHNNLYTPQLTCLDNNTGIIDSIVHHEGEVSAQMLIDLAMADIQARQPPVVPLSHGWTLHLNQTSYDHKQIQSSSSNKPRPTIISASLVAAITVMILLLSIQ